MEIPDYACKIELFCSVNPSEDPKKVEQAVNNIFPNIEIKINKTSLKAVSQNLEDLTNIYNAIHLHRSYRIYRQFLNNNQRKNTTWFYLNKQAAFADSIVLCDEAQESALGPIKIILTSQNIEQIINWLVS